MKIERVETLRHPARPRFVWVRVWTAEGPVGLGEVGHYAGASAAVIHDLTASHLVGADPLAIDRVCGRRCTTG